MAGALAARDLNALLPVRQFPASQPSVRHFALYTPDDFGRV
jgi:hypothetical protein